MQRREFITLLGGVAAAWPLAAGAQQGERVRRVGVLMTVAADDQGQARLAALVQELRRLGWIDGRNLRIDVRWAAAKPEQYHLHAAELLGFAPDVLVGEATPSVVALQQATRSVPIVFVTVLDPVGAGLVASLARPAGNTTGFALSQYGISAKWLELLKAIVPGVKHVAVLRDPSSIAGTAQLAAMQTIAPSLGIELTPFDVRDVEDFERDSTAFARSSYDGLIVTMSATQAVKRKLIVALAARLRLPAIYPFRYMATAGGLISYGPEIIDPYRRVAIYVDRILKGEKPADMPVQMPVKYETVVNLKTAKTLGLNMSRSLLARADEVIE